MDLQKLESTSEFDGPVEGQFDDADEVEIKNMRNHLAIFGLDQNEEDEQFDDGQYSDDNEDDDFYEYYDEEHRGPNSQRKSEFVSSLNTVDDFSKKFAAKINVEKFEGANLSSAASNKMITNQKKHEINRTKVKDKQDRATVEQVMDPRTRMILFKLIGSEKIISLDGCISTGKEANVYHATGADESSFAIKIYKTSILTFKSRDKYVSGDFRFRNAYGKKNPRKMVRTWAEKEFRNLLRIHQFGNIKVPCPRILKSHVVVMDFIGENGWPCPLLQAVKWDQIDFSAENLKEFVKDDQNEDFNEPLQLLLKKLYKDCLIILYRLYKRCHLVHADFSEFNLILKDFKELYVIDVSQSVEHDHPRSLDFLRSDIKNVQDFFGKRGVLIGDDASVFNYITSPSVTDAECDQVLEDILVHAKHFEAFNVDKEVFRQTFIPKKMEDVAHFERDIKKAKRGKEPVYAKVLGLKPDLSVARAEQAEEVKNTSKSKDTSDLKENDNIAEDTDSDDSDDGSDSDSDDKSKFKTCARPKNETADEKKERKKAVREEKATKRETKVKKHIKKRKEKLAHPNSKR